MKDPFNLFIEDSVYYTKNEYYKLMFETKRVFFEFLSGKKTLEEFEVETSRIWNKVDHTYMKQRIKELELMIAQKELDGHKIINPNAVYEEYYKLNELSKFFEIENNYKGSVDRYYRDKLKVINREYINEKAYLKRLVSNYDDFKGFKIAYYNKDGTIHSYHTIADYLSMLYNVNLNRAGWNRTNYDGKLLGNNLQYLPAHTLACPLCQEWQGKLYSSDGTSGYIDGMYYRPKEIAIDGGIGHPNCKHQFVLYWDREQVQKDRYDNEEWVEKYKTDQKIKALKLKRSKLLNDKKIYKSLEEHGEVDKVQQKIRRVNAELLKLRKQDQ